MINWLKKFEYQYMGYLDHTINWLTKGKETGDKTIMTYSFYENGFGKRRIKIHCGDYDFRYKRKIKNNKLYCSYVLPWLEGSTIPIQLEDAPAPESKLKSRDGNILTGNFKKKND